MEPNHTVYLVPTFTDGRGGGRGAISVAIKKTWSSIINYCEKNPPKTIHFTTW